MPAGQFALRRVEPAAPTFQPATFCAHVAALPVLNSDWHVGEFAAMFIAAGAALMLEAKLSGFAGVVGVPV